MHWNFDLDPISETKRDVFVFFFVFVFVCVFVIVIPGGLWIANVISFQKIYGLIGWQWSCDDLLGCRGDLDFSCGRAGGWTGIEGTLRGPRGPKKQI